MNKKSDSEKILVRNTSRPLPQTKIISNQKLERGEKKSSRVENVTKENNLQSLKNPDLNSCLQIPRKIDKVMKNRGLGETVDVAFSEQLTRKINFPPDKAIYKDLIPLEVLSKTPRMLSSREPLPQKNKEPVLSMFAKGPEKKEYVYNPLLTLESQPNIVQLNNLKLYKMIQLNSE